MGTINIHKYLCRPLPIVAFYMFTGRTLFDSSFEFFTDNVILFDKHYIPMNFDFMVCGQSVSKSLFKSKLFLLRIIDNILYLLL